MMKVVIVGGGMVGMTLAHLLRRRGCEPTVLERMPAGHYIPRGYMLGFQGYEPLEEVGVYDAVVSDGISTVTLPNAFVAYDRRMKQTVTSWQMRLVDGEQRPNDHADAAYDAAVRAGLVAFHAEVDAWLAPHAVALPRLGLYARRLSLAAERVGAGDGKHIASPRVDSYHGVWFELHEDLIALAGRTRAEEVAAGRA